MHSHIFKKLGQAFGPSRKYRNVGISEINKIPFRWLSHGRNENIRSIGRCSTATLSIIHFLTTFTEGLCKYYIAFSIIKLRLQVSQRWKSTILVSPNNVGSKAGEATQALPVILFPESGKTNFLRENI